MNTCENITPSPGKITKKSFRKNIKVTALSLIKKIRDFDICTTFSYWWSNESKAAKTAFFSALIIGFVSNLFVYTYRYFGDHDLGVVYTFITMPEQGRPFNLNALLNHGYILPLTSGVFVSFFLGVAAFFFCKLFSVNKKVSGLLIGALLSTFPTISVWNKFIFITADIYLGMALAVIAVYLTVRYKKGFILGAFLLMFALSIYQANVNVAVVLCMLYLVSQLMCKDISNRVIVVRAVRFITLGGLSAIFYIFLLRFMDMSPDYRGFDTMQDRLLSFSGIVNALRVVLADFHRVFFGNFFLNVNVLRYSYIFLAMLLLYFVLAGILRHKIYKNPIRLIIIVGLLLFAPFGSMFASILQDGPSASQTLSPIVYLLAFVVVICERYVGRLVIFRSLTILCILLISINYVILNNIVYMRLAFLNQRTNSVAIQLMTDINPLIPQSSSNQIAFFVEIIGHHSSNFDLDGGIKPCAQGGWTIAWRYISN